MINWEKGKGSSDKWMLNADWSSSIRTLINSKAGRAVVNTARIPVDPQRLLVLFMEHLYSSTSVGIIYVLSTSWKAQSTGVEPHTFWCAYLLHENIQTDAPNMAFKRLVPSPSNPDLYLYSRRPLSIEPFEQGGDFRLI